LTRAFESQIRPEAYAGYLAGWRERTRAEKEHLVGKFQESRTLAEDCVGVLVRRYPIRRAWLIGSLLTPDYFHAASDIDLVVEGLPSKHYFAALSCLYDLLPPDLESDLITLETAQPGLREHIMKEGKLLYERA